MCGTVEEAVLAFRQSLAPSQRIGVAVSGGSDSTALLVALADVLGPCRVEAFTVDHGFRAASADEARRVAQLCRGIGVLHRTLKLEADIPQTGLQAFAREERHRLLFKVARERGLSILALAHTLDDQDETLRMRQRRGASSVAARAGMPRATLLKGALWLVRPFLDVTRQDVRAFLARRAIGWIDDPSNDDARFERVRLRKAPDPGGRRDRLADAARARELLHATSEEAAQILAHAQGSPLQGYSLEPDMSASKASLYAMLALIDLAGGAARAPDCATVSAIGAFLAQAGPERMTAGRTVLSRKGNRFVVHRERRNLPEIVIEPGKVAVWDARFRIRNLSAGTALRVVSGQGNACPPLLVRGDAEFSAVDGVPGAFAVEPLAGRAGYLCADYAEPVFRQLVRLAGVDPEMPP